MGKFIKWDKPGAGSRVSILGLGDQGRVIQENARGERSTSIRTATWCS